MRQALRERPGPSFASGAPGVLRTMNARAVLELLHREAPLPRAEIAARTGLSKPTVSLALTSLVDVGVVGERGHVVGRKGPAAALYEIRAGSGLAVGIHVGHDRIRAALTDLAATVLAQTKTTTSRTVPGLVTQIRALVTALAAEGGVAVGEIRHLVVGVPAAVDVAGERLSLSDGLPDDGREFPQALRRAFSIPVTLENDVNLAALGERERGHGRAVDDFVFLSLGGGLGLGIMLGGRLHRGRSGAAGEVGYLPGDDPTVAPTPPRDRPMIEATLSGASVVDEAAARGLDAELSVAQIFDLARSGNAAALAVVEVVAARIAYVISSATAVLDPELVVLGGGVGANPDLLREPVTRHLHGMSPFAPRIEFSEAGVEAVLYGAVALASELARTTVFTAATA